MKLVNTSIAGTAAMRDKKMKEFKKRYSKVTIVKHKTSVTQRGLYGPYWYEVNGWE